MRELRGEQDVVDRPRTRRVFWCQVIAAATLLVVAAVQASSLHDDLSWFAVLALVLAILAAVLCAICAVFTWRDLHSEMDELDRR
ncbi:MAG: hypothetical protein ACRDQ5_17370 [Sciscionella sp.]